MTIETIGTPIGASTAQEAVRWLQDAIPCLEPYLSLVGPRPADVRVFVGFPSTGGTAKRRRVIGQCWAPEASKDGSVQIFISPMIAEPVEVLATLLHELLHAVVGNRHKHDKTFAHACRAVGLEGRPTATEAGEDLAGALKAIAEELGPYPHAPLSFDKDAPKSKGRMMKAYCINDECPDLEAGEGKPFTTRLTRLWIDIHTDTDEQAKLELEWAQGHDTPPPARILTWNCPGCGNALVAEVPNDATEEGGSGDDDL